MPPRAQAFQQTLLWGMSFAALGSLLGMSLGWLAPVDYQTVFALREEIDPGPVTVGGGVGGMQGFIGGVIWCPRCGRGRNDFWHRARRGRMCQHVATGQRPDFRSVFYGWRESWLPFPQQQSWASPSVFIGGNDLPRHDIRPCNEGA